MEVIKNIYTYIYVVCSCQLWDVDSANIQLFYTAWLSVFAAPFTCIPEPINKLLPVMFQNDIRKVSCDRVQSFLERWKHQVIYL